MKTALINILVILHNFDLVEWLQRMRLRRAEARLGQSETWLNRECEYHDEHLLYLDGVVTERTQHLHNLRMQYRKDSLMRRVRQEGLA